MRYNVTAVSEGGKRVPVAEEKRLPVASRIAEEHAAADRWPAVEISESGTGTVRAAYLRDL